METTLPLMYPTAEGALPISHQSRPQAKDTEMPLPKKQVTRKAYPGTSLVVQWLRIHFPGFPGGAVVKNLPANAGDTGSSPGLGRSHMSRSN